jgi:CTP:molybdopterin cytidylyltransferase MocA
VNPALAILAAGESRRLGECKALVDLGGATALEHLLAAGASCDAAPPLVVVGAHAVEIAERAPRGCEVLHHAGWREGRTSSARAAQRARAGFDLALAPIDVPLVPEHVFEALVRRWRELGSPAGGWLAPRLGADGPFGHPIVLGRALAARMRELAARARLRDLRAWADPLAFVEVASGRILDDLDTPEDLERLRRLAEPRIHPEGGNEPV